ncbi:MAG: DEAD/DEAH box helicase [Gemmataceae bacterium]|nr:DEAD/DEAH box helicase [Gemmataceae bacterium]
MTLSTQLAPFVDPQIQKRGRGYIGSVRLESADADAVVANVQGSELYHVELWREGREVNVWCNCPYFQDNLVACKHIWATILVAEANHKLIGDGKPGALTLVEYADESGEGPGFFGGPEDYEDDDGDWEEEPAPYVPTIPFRPQGRAATGSRKRDPNWKQILESMRPPGQPYVSPGAITEQPGHQVLYVIDVEATLTGTGLVVELNHRHRKKDGDWSKPKSQRLSHGELERIRDADDRRILALLGGARSDAGYGYSYSYGANDARYRFPTAIQDELLPLICRTGRCFFRRSKAQPDLQPIQWDDAGPWQFWLRVAPQPSSSYLVTGQLRRGEECKELSDPVLLVDGGLVLWNDRIGPLDVGGAFAWARVLRNVKNIKVPAGQVDEFINTILRLPSLPRLDLPPELAFEEVSAAPRVRLQIKKAAKQWGAGRLDGELSFDYDGATVPAFQPGRGILQPEPRRLLVRDPAAENAAIALLRSVGFQNNTYYGRGTALELAARNLPRAVQTLTQAGWQVEAEGKLYRHAGGFHIEVKSGIDWFDLEGRVDFGDTSATLPELLKALQRGENSVRLDDGTFGILPEQWLRKYAPVAGLGTVEDGHLRFTRSQVGLLDALLAAQPDVSCDAAFGRARAELRRFEGIEPAEPPKDFVGELRGYQREGLGWLQFLQRFGFGGCLADDMGLGKTVMVLALLESRRLLRAKKSGKDRPPPSLVVVPKSLIFNWISEAARFTPQLRALDHTGIARQAPGEHFDEYDVILTTYGTLRRDALAFKDRAFDYCILDEAQAVKNSSTASAKAVRLIRCSHRLALSGTPVENHLGELWSLLDFLNPGMLGTASAFNVEGGLRHPDAASREVLAKALRPFILRRTKEQVAKDLPAKTEQTIYCELEPAQRKSYDELRRHFQQALLAEVDRNGIRKSSLHILEALLRLRQAACHPGLIDKAKIDEPSAKVETLRAQLDEVLAEGHKVLVFSQFTSLLAILRKQLDRDGISYVYLDGRTRDRAAKVEQFQNDPESKLFLISLKAGGLGLNLTAAEYVFLLDPWWNPAVEAQAIDRAHRIGQTKPVFAYRLIAKDTVEEKVLALQQSKRALADAIINADNSLIRNLDRKDLELLLS